MELSIRDVTKCISILNATSSYNLSEYALNSLTRRIEYVLQMQKLSIEELMQKLESSAEFREFFITEITVNTTELFRDIEFWHDLKYNILPKFSQKKEITIWISACSTGLEVYSLVILLHTMGLMQKCNIFATDIDSIAIQQAKSGMYSLRHKREFEDAFTSAMCYNPYDMSENNLQFSTYFTENKQTNSIGIKPAFLSVPQFAIHNMVNCAPPINEKFDIVFCRNLLIYFNDSLQNKVLSFLHTTIEPGGYLIIGKQELLPNKVQALYAKDIHAYKKI